MSGGGPTPTDGVDPDLLAALAGLAARPRLLVALDFDGVLAPIVDSPDAARPLPAAADALDALARLPGVAVALISGRALADLRAVAAPPPSAMLVGGHGAEIGAPADAAADQAEPDEPDETDETDKRVLPIRAAELLVDVTRALQQISAAHAGTHVEVKPSGAALHTRRAGRRQARTATIEALAGPASWPGVYLTPGKEVVEFSVVDATKGAALQRLRDAAGLPVGGVLYVGDDATDERAFAVLDDDLGDVTVKVGQGPTSARHRLAGPPEVATMLTELARGQLAELARRRR